jgi:hypothetical protein
VSNKKGRRLWRWITMAIKSGQTVRKTKIKSKKFPGSRELGSWKLYGSSPFWEIIEDESVELVENRDIELTTHPDLVIGSLVKRIEESKKNNNQPQ